MAQPQFLTNGQQSDIHAYAANLPLPLLSLLCCPTGLSDSSSKVQVSAVNMLNLALNRPEMAGGLAAKLQGQEQALLNALSGLLDHSLALLRAKAIVTIMLLCRCVISPSRRPLCQDCRTQGLHHAQTPVAAHLRLTWCQ